MNEFFALSHTLEIAPSLWKYYKTKPFVRLMKVFDEMTEIIMKYINNAVQRLEAKDKIGGDRGDRSVLEKLLEINRQIAIVMAFDMLMAGMDTVKYLFVLISSVSHIFLLK